MLATSSKTRGGVTAVLKAYQRSPFWAKYRVKWIETHIDKTFPMKLGYAVRGLMYYLFQVSSYDLIHIHTSELPSVKRKWIFIKIARLLRKKIVVHLHIGNQLEGQENNLFYRQLFHDADAILVLSQSIKTKLEQDFKAKDKVHVVYNPCMTSVTNRSSVRTNTILFAGTLNKNKAYALLIEAFAKIAGEFLDWVVVLAGNGELDEARKLAEEYGVSSQIMLPGWVSGSEKAELFEKATVFCLPSYAEGFPMAVLDAWSYGLPVVSTPVGALPDILVDEKDVLFFPTGQAEALATQLKRILSDEQLRSSLSEASLRMATGFFSMQSIDHQLQEIYNQLVD